MCQYLRNYSRPGKNHSITLNLFFPEQVAIFEIASTVWALGIKNMKIDDFSKNKLFANIF